MKKIVSDFFEEIDFDDVETCKVDYEDCVTCLSRGYWKSVGVDYSCLNKRNLYVVRYLPVHVREVMDCLELADKEKTKEIMNLKKLNVVCLGGGPGTDNLAFNKWLSKNRLFDKGKIKKVRIVRVDKCKEWDEISTKITGEYFPDDIELKRFKNNHDVTKHDIRLGESADIFIMSYIISEIESVKLNVLARNIKQYASKTALIVVNDRNQLKVREKIDRLYGLLNVNDVIISEEQKHCGVSFPDEVSDKAKPKFSTSSIKYCGKL